MQVMQGRWRMPWLQAVLVLCTLALTGCATVANPDPRDPWESWNRGVFGFNDTLDTAVLKPVATGYQKVTPTVVQKGIGNFFGNLTDMWSVVNNALALRPRETGDSIGRVMLNTTVGLLGFIDVASDLGIERHTADFGLTLARWGVGNGPYVVLPLLGPSTLRDTAGLPVDNWGNPVNQITDEQSRTGAVVLKVVDTRAQLLGASKVLDGAALDKYTFMRDAYLQRRRNQVYDGNPPDDELPPEPGQ
ncbi:VacJ family lipoprotein [Curvibacter sp. APW13]|uniref:MlaA family lipoprotein n=1 Tax=Curvibacter sp. APW13 TaxID=3077236 RepID=UPI0028DF7521|nr:VacJ family lipoprotein [Curvibacter sp. APW13]MDT8989575.1 VacJ family lipoprotein [Curvibacter sp. APW13]